MVSRGELWESFGAKKNPEAYKKKNRWSVWGESFQFEDKKREKTLFGAVINGKKKKKNQTLFREDFLNGGEVLGENEGCSKPSREGQVKK